MHARCGILASAAVARCANGTEATDSVSGVSSGAGFFFSPFVAVKSESLDADDKHLKGREETADAFMFREFCGVCVCRDILEARNRMQSSHKNRAA